MKNNIKGNMILSISMMLLSITMVYGELSLTSSDIQKRMDEGYTLSVSNSTYSECGSTKDIYNQKYPNYTRSDCFRDGEGYKYFICPKGDSCVAFGANTSRATPNTSSLQVGSDAGTGTTMNVLNQEKLDAFLKTVIGKRAEWNDDSRYKNLLNTLLDKLNTLGKKYSSNTTILSMVGYLSAGVKEIQNDLIKNNDIDNFFCDLVGNCGNTSTGSITSSGNLVSVTVTTGTVACGNPGGNDYTVYSTPENKKVILNKSYCTGKGKDGKDGKIWTICSTGEKFQNIKSIDNIKDGDMFSCGITDTATQTSTTVTHNTTSDREGAIYSERYEICNTEHRIASCVDFLKDFPGVVNMYSNPNNIPGSCDGDKKADTNGWTMNYFISGVANSDIVLKGWGCSVEHRLNHCRKGTHIEVDAETIKKETGITNLTPNTWLAGRNANYADKFLPGSNGLCDAKVNGQMYYKQWHTKADMQDFTYSRRYDDKGQYISWSSTNNIKKLSWVSKGPNGTVSDDNAKLNHSSDFSSFEDLRLNGWIAGTYDMIWTTTSVDGTKKEIKETFTIPDSGNSSATNIVCDNKHYRSGSSCVANIPTLIVTRTPRVGTIGTSNTVSWTSTNAKKIGYSCTGGFNSFHGDISEIGLKLNDSITANFNAAWLGSTHCFWWAVDFDGNQKAVVNDDFTVTGK